MIRRYGVDIAHKKKVITDIGDGEVEISYEIQEPKRGQYTEVTPLDTLVGRWGQRVEADFIVTFLPEMNAHISEGDLLYLDGSWTEVLDKFPRLTGSVIDYLEIHTRRRGT